jgi:2',3'-cyclic-nucleotide 2'-phosphodiesterase (5'-nucleotidase family)
MIAVGPYALLLALLGVVALAGCRPSGPRQPLVVVAGGDTSGWIAPCGCASNQSGGLPRRATYVEGLHRQAATILVDVGGAAHGASPYDLAKFEAILRGESLMGVAAHNLGAAEAHFGPGELRRLAAKLAVPILSANVRDRAGRIVAAPLVTLSAGGRRVALIGVLAERYATADV